MPDTAAPASSAVVAFVTAVHAALLIVHLQRVRGWLRLAVSVPAIAFGVMAWALSTPAWLAAGVAANTGWAFLAAITTRHSAHLPTAAAQPGRASGKRPDGTDPGGTSPAAGASGAFVKATVLAVVPESETVRTFRLTRPPGFDFEPGQFLMVRVEADGATQARCYSISSPPGATGYLEISVRRQGHVSALLHDRVLPGHTLLIHPPLGRFTVPRAHDGDLVLVAGGIGITPVVSMLRHEVSCHPLRRITLLYSIHSVSDAAFREELEWLAKRHAQLRLIVTVTGPATVPGCRHGRIGAELLGEGAATLAHPLFFICGPLPMIDAVRAALGGLAVAADRVRFEAFEAATAMAAGAGRGAAGVVPGRLRLSRTGVEIAVQADESLLEAAERAGADIPSFCRAGVCGTCRTRLLSGDARCSAEALSDEERERGFVLPCVAFPSGDCILEA